MRYGAALSSYSRAVLGFIVLNALILLTFQGFRGLGWGKELVISLGISSFVMAGFDKLSARRGAGRVPELAFYTFSVLGGWPGLIAGMLFFRHKTAKAKFGFYLILTILVNLVFVRLGWRYLEV